MTVYIFDGTGWPGAAPARFAIPTAELSPGCPSTAEDRDPAQPQFTPGRGIRYGCSKGAHPDTEPHVAMNGHEQDSLRPLLVWFDDDDAGALAEGVTA